MRYAFMSFSCPELTYDEMLAAAVEYGYDGIEPRTAAGHAHGVELTAGPAERAEFKAKAEAAGIDHCCLALSSRFADPATVDDTVEETRHYIDLAADIGAPTIRVFGGKLPDGVTREAAIEGVSVALASLADYAAERDVIICLETHDDRAIPIMWLRSWRRWITRPCASTGMCCTPCVSVPWILPRPTHCLNHGLHIPMSTTRPLIRPTWVNLNMWRWEPASSTIDR